MFLHFEIIISQIILNQNIRKTIKEECKDTIENSDRCLLVKGEFIENDTLFFTQEFLKKRLTKYGQPLRNTTIFLEPSKDSHYYTQEYWIEHLGGEFWKEQLLYWNQKRKEKSHGSLQKVNTFGLPIDWIPLHFYKGVPCAYVPCEVDVPVQRRLSDSLLIYRYLEVDFTPLEKSDKLSESLYHFAFAATDWSSAGDLYIHIIDKKTKAAVWEYHYQDEEEYILMIPVESVSSFDLIVCSAPYQKYFGNQQELFDKVDVKALLEEARSGKRKNLFN